MWVCSSITTLVLFLSLCVSGGPHALTLMANTPCPDYSERRPPGLIQALFQPGQMDQSARSTVPETERQGPSLCGKHTYISTHTRQKHPLESTVEARETGDRPEPLGTGHVGKSLPRHVYSESRSHRLPGSLLFFPSFLQQASPVPSTTDQRHIRSAPDLEGGPYMGLLRS